MNEWGPESQQERVVRGPVLPRWARWIIGPLALYGWTVGPGAPVSVLTIAAGVCQLIVLGICAARAWGWAARTWHTLTAHAGGRADRELLPAGDPLTALRRRAALAGGVDEARMVDVRSTLERLEAALRARQVASG